MRVFGLWHGGAGYSYGTLEDDCEMWPSLADAKRSLIERYESRNWHHAPCVRVKFDAQGFGVVTDESSDAETPCVDETCTIDLYPATRQGDLWQIWGEPYLRLSLSFYPRNDDGTWREPKLRGVKVESF